jgi:hypothetical protein
MMAAGKQEPGQQVSRQDAAASKDAARSVENADVGEQPKGPGADEVQDKMDEATGQGFYGVEIDSTPNEAYTVQGVLAGQPTPETDPEHAENIRRELRSR